MDLKELVALTVLFASLAGSVGTAVVALMKNVPSYAVNSIIRRNSHTIAVNDEDNRIGFININQHLLSLGNKYLNRHTNSQVKWGQDQENRGVSVYALNQGTYNILYKACWLQIYVSIMENKNYVTNKIDIQIIGKNAKKIASEFKTIIDKRDVQGIDLDKFFKVKSFDGDEQIVTYKPKVLLDEICCSETQKIKKILDHFLDMEDYYKNIIRKPYKTAFFFEGQPGTGKTAIAHAIACYTGFDLYDMDISNIDKISRIKDKAVIFFDDIDMLLKDGKRKNVNNDESYQEQQKEEDNSPANAIIAATSTEITRKLMHILDGTKTPNNCIFIFATNSANTFDAGLIRSSRFNHRIEISPLTEELGKKMAKIYRVDYNKLGLTAKDYPITQAKMSDILLQNVDIYNLV